MVQASPQGGPLSGGRILNESSRTSAYRNRFWYSAAKLGGKPVLGWDV
jgi:hypothetical protein